MPTYTVNIGTVDTDAQEIIDAQSPAGSGIYETHVKDTVRARKKSGAWTVSDGDMFPAIDGYDVAYFDDFNSLRIIGPASDEGWFPSRLYANGVGTGYPQRGPTTSPNHYTDPLYTGYNDSNSGVSVGYNNMRVAASILTLQTRAATAGERDNLADPINNLNIQSMICSAGEVVFSPGVKKIILEARMKINPDYNNRLSKGFAAFWTISCAPPNPNSSNQDEIDIIELNDDGTAGSYVHEWVDGASAGPVGDTFTPTDVWDGQWHIVRVDLDHTSLQMYIDGVLKATVSTDANKNNLPQMVMFQTGMRSNPVQSEWDASGTTDSSGLLFDVDWVRIHRDVAASKFTPLVTVSDIDVAYQGVGSIVLPSKLALWGDAAVSEYVGCVGLEVQDPGMSTTAPFVQFPTGVSYDSETRTISVDFTAISGNAGRIYCVVYAYADGAVCNPARFTINRLGA